MRNSTSHLFEFNDILRGSQGGKEETVSLFKIHFFSGRFTESRDDFDHPSKMAYSRSFDFLHMQRTFLTTLPFFMFVIKYQTISIFMVDLAAICILYDNFSCCDRSCLNWWNVNILWQMRHPLLKIQYTKSHFHSKRILLTLPSESCPVMKNNPHGIIPWQYGQSTLQN